MHYKKLGTDAGWFSIYLVSRGQYHIAVASGSAKRTEAAKWTDPLATAMWY